MPTHPLWRPFETVTPEELAEARARIGVWRPEAVVVVAPDPAWPAAYDEVCRQLRDALGERVVTLEHVGSTAVPGLWAKPVIDVDLVVPEPADEAAWLPDLEAAGFVLRVREPEFEEHRVVRGSRPSANVHVWGPDGREVRRHVLFRDWLRTHDADRERYGRLKRGGFIWSKQRLKERCMPKRFPSEVREAFVQLICGGSSLRSAAAVSGVSLGQSVAWWRESGHMSLSLVAGARGGLGSTPSDLVDSGGVRRPLSIDDRVLIAVGVHRRWTLQRIAEDVGRDRSVVCREIRRNRSPDGVYRASVAHRAAAGRRVRPRRSKLAANPGLCRQIEAWMDEGWSPRLISQVLAHEGASHTDRVSHETIYQALYVQTRGSLRADLHRCLSLKRSRRKPRSSDRKSSSPYREAFKISQRPAEVADRAVPGHWEGDLINSGAGSNCAIGTLVERSTRFTILLHLPNGHDSASVAEAMIREMGKLPEHLRRSITWDRGVELAKYADIQTALDLELYFCDPHSPWQRGTNENTNRLLRHWFEKGSDLSIHTAEDLDRIAASLNARPRPTLDLDTPAQRLNQLLLQAAA